MQIVPFISTHDRVTRQRNRIKVLANKGDTLFAIRNPDGKYFHYCYTDANIADKAMYALYSSDRQGWVRSTDQARVM